MTFLHLSAVALPWSLEIQLEADLLSPLLLVGLAAAPPISDNNLL